MQISQSETRIACDGHAVHRYFLPIFSSFGEEVSEEMIKMRKVNRRRTPNEICFKTKVKDYLLRFQIENA
jgi:high-affinity K+ transport system ATPase subunit B